MLAPSGARQSQPPARAPPVPLSRRRRAPPTTLPILLTTPTGRDRALCQPRGQEPPQVQERGRRGAPPLLARAAGACGSAAGLRRELQRAAAGVLADEPASLPACWRVAVGSAPQQLARWPRALPSPTRTPDRSPPTLYPDGRGEEAEAGGAGRRRGQRHDRQRDAGLLHRPHLPLRGAGERLTHSAACRAGPAARVPRRRPVAHTACPLLARLDSQTLPAHLCTACPQIGLNTERIRFRQHLQHEMAHYAEDCWDFEASTARGAALEAGAASAWLSSLSTRSGAAGLTC